MADVGLPFRACVASRVVAGLSLSTIGRLATALRVSRPLRRGYRRSMDDTADGPDQPEPPRPPERPAEEGTAPAPPPVRGDEGNGADAALDDALLDGVDDADAAPDEG